MKKVIQRVIKLVNKSQFDWYFFLTQYHIPLTRLSAHTEFCIALKILTPSTCSSVRYIFCALMVSTLPEIVSIFVVCPKRSSSKADRFLSSTYQKADYDAIVKTRKKGFQETANFSKSLGIPCFKPISVLFYLFLDSRQTVSTCCVNGNIS